MGQYLLPTLSLFISGAAFIGVYPREIGLENGMLTATMMMEES